MLADVLSWTAFVVAVVASLPLAYLLLLTLLSFAAFAKRAPAAVRGGQELSLVAVIPAHNEQDGIGATVKSLLDAPYPAEKKRVVVVADNCKDATAQRARDAGAEVLERSNDTLRGKGYALELAFEHVLDSTSVDVDGVLVIDADTVVADNLWSAMGARLAAGHGALQCANRVRNRDASWRTRLLAIALAMINGVRCRGRERLSLSVGLKGNGMAFSADVLRKHPQKAYGLVEDLEHALALGLGGVRVAYAAETWIASESPVTAASAVSQRRRWEGGRMELIRTLLPRLLRQAFATRSAVLFDLALELLIPPLSYPAALLVVAAALQSAHVLLTGALSPTIAVWWFGMGALSVHVLAGLVLSGTGLRGLQALLLAPVYIGWKLVVAKPWARREATWVRTTRVSELESRKPLEPLEQPAQSSPEP